MKNRSRSVLIVGGVAVTVLMVVGVWFRHRNDRTGIRGYDTQQVAAPSLDLPRLERSIRSEVATDVTVTRLDEFVVLRGTVEVVEDSQRAETIARAHGARRVVNMLRPRVNRDEEIRRSAERELARDRAFDDCRFAIECKRGVVRVTGRVRSELQADAMRAAIRRIPGVERVETSLSVF